MFEIILLVYLSYRNSIRAKLKEENPWAWAIYTGLAFLATFILGFLIVVFNFCKDAVNFNLLSSTDPKVREAVSQQLIKVLSDNPLHMITIDLFGIGGYLLVRYLLDRKPEKKKPEVHWMDKINEQQ